MTSRDYSQEQGTATIRYYQSMRDSWFSWQILRLNANKSGTIAVIGTRGRELA